MERIEQFVNAADTAARRRARDQQVAVRDALQSELRGMAEFVNVNGRLHRYGFVSRDNQRTRDILRAMFESPAAFSQAVGLPVQHWDDIDSAQLKLHLQTSRLSHLLPAPLVRVNTDARNWLQSVYLTLHRLNDDWGTRFTSWDEVVGDARDATQDDIDKLRGMLMDITTRLLEPLPEPEAWDIQVKPVPGHGIVEVVFAHLARRRGVPEAYMLLLRYLAQSAEDGTFTPLPPGKHSTDKTAIHAFIADFYPSREDFLRDWPTPPRIPATTTPSVESFQTLVDCIPK